jgi:hypothetical protein
MVDQKSLPDDLAAFLLLHATVSARDEDATRQVLRFAAESLPEAQGHKVAAQLYNAISGGSRMWLQNRLY